MDLNSIIDVSSLLEQSYSEVNYKDFYRDIFPLGSLEEKGVYEVGKYNAIARAIKVGDNKTKRYIVTDDLDVLDKLVECDDFLHYSTYIFYWKVSKE